MKLETAKGVRDIAAADKIAKDAIVAKLKAVFEGYGYAAFESPIIEREELLVAKAGAGEESDAAKERFRLTDQGGRKLGLRFELTLSMARYVGSNPSLKLPFKRYEIGPVFRDGPIKLGRYRQFWQCDVDCVGPKPGLADAEMVNVALDAFDSLGLDAYLEVNNRKVLQAIIIYAGIDPDLTQSVLVSLDKLAKVGRKGVETELEQKRIGEQARTKLLDCTLLDGSNEEKLLYLKSILTSEIGRAGIAELEQVFELVKDPRVRFNPSLARGLAYYTGTIYEGFAKSSQVSSSICGGGRYDEMLGKLSGSERQICAAGLSFGLDTLCDVLGSGKNRSSTQAYVIAIKSGKPSFAIAQKLRASGIRVEMDLMERTLSKNLEYASVQMIPFAIIVGPKELEQGKIKLRDMQSGQELLTTVEEAIELLKTKQNA